MAKNIVIIGGGIIGCTTSYYLSQDPKLRDGDIKVTLIEASCIAAGASGKSGGFLARDWHRPETAELGKLSYKCHQDLARQYGGLENWSFRPLDTCSVSASVSSRNKPVGQRKNADWRVHESINGMRGAEDDWLTRDLNLPASESDETKEELKDESPSGLDWLDPENVEMCQTIGDKSDTAGLDPEKFTKFIFEKAVESGVEFVKGRATRLIVGDAQSPSINAVEYIQDDTKSPEREPRRVQADQVVLCAGPWTGSLMRELLSDVKLGVPAHIPIGGYSGHSIVYKSKVNYAPYALFTNISTSHGVETPEVFTRPNEIYICGVNGREREPPVSARHAVPEDQKIRRLQESAEILVPTLRGQEIIKKQVCFRPSSNDSVPVMGGLAGVLDGLYIASGHTCWGISLGPGSGKCMSEILLGRESPCDISELDPMRYVSV